MVWPRATAAAPSFAALASPAALRLAMGLPPLSALPAALLQLPPLPWILLLGCLHRQLLARAAIEGALGEPRRRSG